MLKFFVEIYRTVVLVWMLAGLAWLGGLISMISESLGTLLTTMRVGPIAIGPPDGEDKLLQDIPEGTFCLLKFKKFQKMPEKNCMCSSYSNCPVKK